MNRSLLVLLVVCFAAVGLGQSDLGGPGKFPEYRGLSGLPGGGFGVTPRGEASIRGAFAFSTPIAYSLARRHGAAALSNLSFGRQVKWFDKGQNSGDGTGALLYGFSGPLGDMTLGGEIVNGDGQSVANVHFTPLQTRRIKFGFGDQDIFSSGGDAGEAFYVSRVSNGRSMSIYGVATADLGKDVFLSAGTGYHRFRHGFANLSFSPTGSMRAYVENDGFNWNVGLAFETKPLFRFSINGAHEARVVAGLHLVRGKYLAWSATATF